MGSSLASIDLVCLDHFSNRFAVKKRIALSIDDQSIFSYLAFIGLNRRIHAATGLKVYAGIYVNYILIEHTTDLSGMCAKEKRLEEYYEII
mgnify:CR=1 FL=1